MNHIPELYPLTLQSHVLPDFRNEALEGLRGGVGVLKDLEEGGREEAEVEDLLEAYTEDVVGLELVLGVGYWLGQTTHLALKYLVYVLLRLIFPFDSEF